MSDCCDSGGGSRRDHYDLAVIGAGSAGFSAAIAAAEEGASVALIGHGTIGGTCVNVGCVPSKTMIRAMEATHGAGAAARFPGLAGEAAVMDWSRLVAAKDDLVATLRRQKYVDLLADYDGIDYLAGQARLDGNGLRVDGAHLSVEKIVLATGASPKLPDLPGIETTPYLTSTSALDLDALPRSMIVVGGGYIGCELAQMFARAGVTVMLATRRRLLPESEPEVSDALTQYLRDEGIDVRTGLGYRGIEATADGVALSVVADGVPETVRAERLLIATGRRPNTDGLGLESAGVALTAEGGVAIDDRMRTSRPGVYAAGDVTGQDQFVYMAAYGAKLAARNALGGDRWVYDNAAMPWVVFTDPQVAGVGLTERTAREAGYETKTSVVPLDQVPRALAARDTRGLIKLVADASTDRLLGAHILAPEGADSIQTMVLALKHGMRVQDLADTLFPYLTTVEGLKLAAQAFDKDVAKLSCCAG